MNRSFMVLMSLVKSPIVRLLLWNTTARPFVADTPICSVAGISANRQGARMFLRAAKTSRWNGNIAREGTAANRAGHDSHFPQENICTAYDSGPHEDRSCRCQGAAQRNVFALWVFAYEAIAADLHRSLRSAFTLLPPCREEECIGC
jgi:hypothetical protein